MSAWHAEVVLVQLQLRRYPGDDAAAAYAAHAPFDGVARADIRSGKAWVSGMLVTGPDLHRSEREQIAELLRRHGAVELEADRHGRLVRLVR